MTNATSTPARKVARRAATTDKRLVTAIEIRSGKTKERNFRLACLTSQNPATALEYVSSKIGVLMKESKPLGTDGYLYAIPQMDSLPTQVRARRLPVYEQLTDTRKSS